MHPPFLFLFLGSYMSPLVSGRSLPQQAFSRHSPTIYYLLFTIYYLLFTVHYLFYQLPRRRGQIASWQIVQVEPRSLLGIVGGTNFP